MREYRRQMQPAKEKAANIERLTLEAQLPMEQLIAGVREDIESFAAELGLTIIQRVMEAEVEQKVGRWAPRSAAGICDFQWAQGGGAAAPATQPRPARGAAFQLQGFSEQWQTAGSSWPPSGAPMLDA